MPSLDVGIASTPPFPGITEPCSLLPSRKEPSLFGSVYAVSLALAQGFTLLL